MQQEKSGVHAHCNTTIGLEGTFSSRLQPNHTTDDPKGIMASVMEGLSLGCGDAVIGLNPVDDSVESVARVLRSFDEFKNKWEVPTQICVLAHVTTQMEACEKQGAPIDLLSSLSQDLRKVMRLSVSPLPCWMKAIR